jgi:hypothetical protein
MRQANNDLLEIISVKTDLSLLHQISIHLCHKPQK